MGNLAAQKGKWGIAVDTIYLAVENNPNMQLPYGAVLRNVQIYNWIVTPTVSYQIVKSDEWTLALLAGARYFSIEPKFTISPFPEQSTSGSIWDGIIGVKGKVDLEGNWSVPYHFDIGTGESDLTWQAFAGVGYEYDNFDIAVGYRHLEWDFSNNKHGGGLFKDISVSGPIVGVKYRF